MQPPIAFDMGCSLRDKACIYLFGVCGGKAQIPIGRCILKAICPPHPSGFFPEEDKPTIVGTLAGTLAGC